jgi:hypothetical protein
MEDTCFEYTRQTTHFRSKRWPQLTRIDELWDDSMGRENNVAVGLVQEGQLGEHVQHLLRLCSGRFSVSLWSRISIALHMNGYDGQSRGWVFFVNHSTPVSW